MSTRRLTYFEAQDYREMGFKLTQLTDTATSLHARELYRIELASDTATEAPRPATRVIACSWESVFGGPEAS